MEFNSWQFVLFFPMVCLIYWALRRHYVRNLFLLVASYYFYMCWKASYGLLLLGATLISYTAAILTERATSSKAKKCWVGAGIVLNLSLIAYFKYANFGVGTFNWLMTVTGIGITVPLPEILLPVGVSFFVFQSVGYAVDVYRGDIAAERNFVNYALFISFFPQLVAGPIERSRNMLPQFKEKRHFNDDMALQGVKLMLWGYFLKLVLADRCAVYVEHIFHSASTDGYSSLLGVFLFSFQIYGDFAGYTYIAIGAARIMGYHLNNNFNHPYFAHTVSDFWRRWHISLSTWFRDYLYFPLGGSRCSKWRCYFNLMVTFLASGLWHGATWAYVLWGGVHGLCMCFERAWGWNKKQWKRLTKTCHMLLTFLIVAFARLIYCAGDTSRAWHFFKRALHPSDLTLGDASTAFSLLLILIAVIVVCAKDAVEEWGSGHFQSRVSPFVRDVGLIVVMIVAISLMASPEGGTFVYFQF